MVFEGCCCNGSELGWADVAEDEASTSFSTIGAVGPSVIGTSSLGSLPAAPSTGAAAFSASAFGTERSAGPSLVGGALAAAPAAGSALCALTKYFDISCMASSNGCPPRLKLSLINTLPPH